MTSHLLDGFVGDMTDITTAHDYVDEADLVMKVGRLLESMVANPASIPDRFCELPDGMSPSARYMLHRSSRFNVSAIVWAPGAVIAPHNHETWGAIGVLTNDIQERRYEVDANDRLDERESRRHRAGAVSLLIPDDDIHSMHNLTDQPTIEIHVYGKELTGLERKCWVDGGKSTQFQSGKYLNC